MKNLFNFKWLLLCIVLSVASVSQVWAWYYVPSNFPPGANWSNTANRMNSGNNLTFHAVPAGTYYFKIYKDGWDNPTGADRFAADPRGGAISANGTNSDGAMWITTTEVADIKFQIKYDESTKDWSDRVYVEAQTATYYIRYNWNNSGWVWSSAMSSNGDGTYACVGTYRGTDGTEYQHSKCNSEYVDGTSGTATIIGTTPSQGENCVFTLKISDNSLTIRKCNTVTHTNYIFFDNSASSLTQTHKYFVIGHPVKAGNAESKTYELSEVLNTKLWLHTSTTDDWSDANYYAVLGSSGYFSNGEWYHDNIKTASEYSAPHLTHFNMENGHNYLVYKADHTNGTAISIYEHGTKSSAMNTKQVFKYALSIDNGGTYSPLTSGVTTPGRLVLSSYGFVDGTYSSVSAKDSTLSEDASVYTKHLDSVAYTATTTLTESNTRPGYTFMGWYHDDKSTARTDGSTHAFTYYPKGDSTYTARYKANQYTVTFDKEDGTGGANSVTATYEVTMPSIAENLPSRAGYTFDGYWDGDNGTGTQYINADGTSAKAWDKTSATTLYAKWDPKELTFGIAGNWKTDGGTGWTDNCIPTSEHPVKISAAVTVNSTDAVAKSITIEDGGKLTISAGAVLEVAGAITSDDENKIEIQSDASNQGALILNNSSAAKATVKMYAKVTSHASFQCIAIPVTSVSVANSFAGSGVYTYVWHEGTGWERRGYYTDLSAFEGIALMQTGVYTYPVSGTLVSTSDFGRDLAYTDAEKLEADTYQGTNVFGNSWTAPIKIAECNITGDAEQTIYVFDNGGWDPVVLEDAEDEIIPALQAYAIIATGDDGHISIPYGTAVRGNTANRAEPLHAPQRTNSEMSQMKLFVSDGERETKLRFFENEMFTDEFDNGWEARYLEGDGLSGQLYVQKDNKMIVLAMPDLEGTVVGFIPGEATNYSISFGGDGKGYYLNDVKKEESTLIAEGNTYEFEADEATNATRFVISKTPISKTPTSVDNLNDGVKARKQLIDGALYIIRDGRMYNAEGAVVK